MATTQKTFRLACRAHDVAVFRAGAPFLPDLDSAGKAAAALLGSAPDDLAPSVCAALGAEHVVLSDADSTVTLEGPTGWEERGRLASLA